MNKKRHEFVHIACDLSRKGIIAVVSEVIPTNQQLLPQLMQGKPTSTIEQEG